MQPELFRKAIAHLGKATGNPSFCGTVGGSRVDGQPGTAGQHSFGPFRFIGGYQQPLAAITALDAEGLQQVQIVLGVMAATDFLGEGQRMGQQ